MTPHFFFEMDSTMQSPLTSGRGPQPVRAAEQSILPTAPAEAPAPAGLHLGIIMDGNGRWAHRRGLPRVAGHRAGAKTVRRIVSAAPRLGVRTLTLYAFSSDNWRRPPLEVRHLMRLLRSHLRTETKRCLDEGVRLSVIGRRDRLEPDLVREIESTEAATRTGTTLHLQLAIDYSAREGILRAAQAAAAQAAASPDELSDDDFRTLLSQSLHLDAPVPDVDLVIRTGGEQRLSDFLLWESAYAELVFTPCAWPDFDEGHLESALTEFSRRDRRFGGLVTPTAPPAQEG